LDGTARRVCSISLLMILHRLQVGGEKAKYVDTVN
jgi:hypothetical protein